MITQKVFNYNEIDVSVSVLPVHIYAIFHQSITMMETLCFINQNKVHAPCFGPNPGFTALHVCLFSKLLRDNL